MINTNYIENKIKQFKKENISIENDIEKYESDSFKEDFEGQRKILIYGANCRFAMNLGKIELLEEMKLIVS